MCIMTDSINGWVWVFCFRHIKLRGLDKTAESPVCMCWSLPLACSSLLFIPCWSFSVEQCIHQLVLWRKIYDLVFQKYDKLGELIETNAAVIIMPQALYLPQAPPILTVPPLIKVPGSRLVSVYHFYSSIYLFFFTSYEKDPDLNHLQKLIMPHRISCARPHLW